MTPTPEALPPLPERAKKLALFLEGIFVGEELSAVKAREIAKCLREMSAALAQRQQVPPLSEDEVRRLWDKACRTVTVQGGGSDVLVFADYLQRETAQRRQVPTTAWLVEWRFNGVQWLYLWPSAPGGFSFTSDASKALRFARREDAEAALQWARNTDAARRPIGSLTRHGLALGEMLVTEHDWPALTAAPSAQAEPVAWRREWDGDDSDLGAWVYVSAGEERDGDGPWQPLYAAPPAAQAEPQEPTQRPALVTALRGLLASLSRQPTEFELRAAAHEFTVMADRAAAAARAGGDDA